MTIKEYDARIAEINSYQYFYDLSESTAAIFKLLKQHKKMYNAEIKQKTNLSQRTIQYCLKDLCDKELIFKTVDFNDMRKTIYCLNEISIN